MTGAIADPARLSSATRMGAVDLTVSDLDRVRLFYENVLGLRSREGPDGTVALSAGDGRPLVVLHGDPAAPARDPHAAGLFHLALLLPSRPDLARALARLAGAGWSLTGASDHLVSEALYLTDPEGNGIELYRDRPESQWPRDRNGTLEMATLPLDLADLLADAGGGPEATSSAIAPGTTVGHVHLQVSDIPRAAAFYVELLGLSPTVDTYPRALFVSAGGYHHHVGLNTWNSTGAPPTAPGSAGLRAFEILVGDRDELDRVTRRLVDGGVTAEPLVSAGEDDHGAVRAHDPFDSALVLRVL